VSYAQQGKLKCFTASAKGEAQSENWFCLETSALTCFPYHTSEYALCQWAL